jgi:hypothetical protein
VVDAGRYPLPLAVAEEVTPEVESVAGFLRDELPHSRQRPANQGASPVAAAAAGGWTGQFGTSEPLAYVQVDPGAIAEV